MKRLKEGSALSHECKDLAVANEETFIGLTLGWVINQSFAPGVQVSGLLHYDEIMDRTFLAGPTKGCLLYTSPSPRD